MGSTLVSVSLNPGLGDYPVYFYKCLINGGYYCLLVPFRITFSNQSGTWGLVSNWRQKVYFNIQIITLLKYIKKWVTVALCDDDMLRSARASNGIGGRRALDEIGHG